MDGGRPAITGLRCKNCIILIKMLIPFSKDSIIISNTPEFTRTIKHRNTMEQYLWSQAWIVHSPDYSR